MNRRDASDALHERARALVRAFEAGAPMPEPFDRLACDLARFQAEHVEGYARLCRARGVDAAALERAEQIPAVPADAFKVTRVAAFPEEEARVRFRTSGTTGATGDIGDARGVHAMRDAITYELAALAFGRRMLMRALPPRVPVVVLGPPPSSAGDSSLTHMLALFAKELGTPASDEETFLLRDGVFDLATFDDRAAHALVGGTPMLVLATSFALVHLLDALDDEPFRLSPGTRVMQTGGFKGRSREVDAPVLRRKLARAFKLEEGAIVSEYGMTELCSQFYEESPNRYAEPPWARVDAVDPVSLEPVPEGAIGIARITDLMNVDSAVVVLAADRVRRHGARFELLGRAPGAPPRGCSIAIEEMMAREDGS
jgi:hypothetical protein